MLTKFIQILDGEPAVVELGRDIENLHQSIGIRKRSRTKKDGVNDAEDRGVDADSERQRDNGNHDKTRST